MNLINKRFKTIEDLNSKIVEEILSIIKVNNRSLFILLILTMLSYYMTTQTSPHTLQKRVPDLKHVKKLRIAEAIKAAMRTSMW